MAHGSRLNGSVKPHDRQTPFATFVTIVLLLCAQVSAGSNCATENSRPGTERWQITNAATNHEIEGYASRTSVAPGSQIALHVSTMGKHYSLQVYRLGWYGGRGGRAMSHPVQLAGQLQPMPTPTAETGLIECHWPVSHVLSIPLEWPSGIYVALLRTVPTHKENYIVFTVCDHSSRAPILFKSSVCTWEAYNEWGGRSLYVSANGAPPAVEVSFDRPYGSYDLDPRFSHVAVPSPALGAGDLFYWEINLLRWLERNGYDVDYCTDLDVHEDTELVRQHRVFLSVGHDEYWSADMRDHIEEARDKGVGLAFFSGNTCYQQVRLEENRRSGERDRTIVSYKCDCSHGNACESCDDPYCHDGDPSNDSAVTTVWQCASTRRPEEALLGVHYSCSNVDSDIVIRDTDSWVFEGTGLRDGDKLKGLLGYEVDQIGDASPKNIQLLGVSPFPCGRSRVESDSSYMTIYRAESGAYVFAAGSVQWSWGLDDYNAPDHRRSRISVGATEITRNILRELAGVAGGEAGSEADPAIGSGTGTVRAGLVAGVPWPVPARDLVHLPFAVDAAAVVTATITDVAGRRLASLRKSCPRAGSFELQWVIKAAEDRTPAPGVYFCRLQAGGGPVATFRIVGR
jgi:N,N-dimethylformamidase beta subunit-like, C-terminal